MCVVEEKLNSVADTMSLKFLWDIQREIVKRQIGYTCPDLKEVDKDRCLGVFNI